MRPPAMPAWLDRLLTPTPAQPTLSERLRDYPPYAAPFSGFGAALTEAQAEANLAHLLRVRDERLGCLGALLHSESTGIDLAAVLASPAGQAAAFTAALHRWAGARWPALHDPRIARSEIWLASRRAGDEIVYSMLLDVAIALGEVIRRAAPDWQWAANLDATDLHDGMTSARRVVLRADAVGAAPAPFVIDIEAAVVGRWLQPRSPSQQLLNPWAQVVEQAISGAHQAWWLAQANKG